MYVCIYIYIYIIYIYINCAQRLLLKQQLYSYMFIFPPTDDRLDIFLHVSA